MMIMFVIMILSLPHLKRQGVGKEFKLTKKPLGIIHCPDE
jgi:hypothetical protein